MFEKSTSSISNSLAQKFPGLVMRFNLGTVSWRDEQDISKSFSWKLYHLLTSATKTHNQRSIKTDVTASETDPTCSIINISQINEYGQGQVTKPQRLHTPIHRRAHKGNGGHVLRNDGRKKESKNPPDQQFCFWRAAAQLMPWTPVHSTHPRSPNTSRAVPVHSTHKEPPKRSRLVDK